LITGAAGGIGRVAAELFAAEGAHVVVADVVEGEGTAAVDTIRDAGANAAFVKADVSDAAACTSSTTTPASSLPTTPAHSTRPSPRGSA
jgi:NAD(P)-dependent dehydrogenase (short-subunit alcohol dehydrogenase family)